MLCTLWMVHTVVTVLWSEHFSQWKINSISFHWFPQERVCVCVRQPVCACACVHLCAHVHVRVSMGRCTHLGVHMCVHAHVCRCVYVHVWPQVCVCVHANGCLRLLFLLNPILPVIFDALTMFLHAHALVHASCSAMHDCTHLFVLDSLSLVTVEAQIENKPEWGNKTWHVKKKPEMYINIALTQTVNHLSYYFSGIFSSLTGTHWSAWLVMCPLIYSRREDPYEHRTGGRMDVGTVTSLSNLTDSFTHFPASYKDPKLLYCENGGYFMRILPDGTVEGIINRDDLYSENPFQSACALYCLNMRVCLDLCCLATALKLSKFLSSIHWELLSS